ncbi:rhodanese-like domain-containing protein [Lacibacter sediminis]|uniref:Rhodanese-like domain-containing protein n=1 Tax=Lacibacter sediminis TaxID=2760713 RepID=A0A7G5XG03_9BACT|nr:rhodanese-like domain-containing protein [Lacibacter sediminis]QNA44406.1 rhodanese-like domain-containing protein [Lacibacter sediminis]
MINFIKKLFGPGTDFKALQQQGAVIIDVRTAGEFNGGHIKGAINIPVDSIRSKINDIKKKGKPVITCCASGMRSGSATSILKQAGVEAYNGGSWMSLQNKMAS